VLSHMRGTLSKLTSKSLMVCTIDRIEQLKIVFEKTSKQEKIRENDKSQKCSFGQSHNLQNQHQKSQRDQAKKKQNIKSQIQECV
jgi:hypothetical protein